MEQVVTVDQDVLKVDSAKEPEVSDAQDRKQERAARSDLGKVAPELAGGVPAEPFSECNRRQARDPKAYYEAAQRDQDQEGDHGVGFAGEGGLRQARDDWSENNHRVDGQLQEPVGTRKVRVGKHLGQDAFFGGRQERAVRALQEQHGQHEADIAGKDSERARSQQSDFEQLQGHDDAALRVAVVYLARV